MRRSRWQSWQVWIIRHRLEGIAVLIPPLISQVMTSQLRKAFSYVRVISELLTSLMQLIYLFFDNIRSQLNSSLLLDILCAINRLGFFPFVLCRLWIWSQSWLYFFQSYFTYIIPVALTNCLFFGRDGSSKLFFQNKHRVR